MLAAQFSYERDAAMSYKYSSFFTVCATVGRNIRTAEGSTVVIQPILITENTLLMDDTDEMSDRTDFSWTKLTSELIISCISWTILIR